MSAPAPAETALPSIRLRPDIIRPTAVMIFSMLFMGVGIELVNQGEHGGWLLIVLFTLAIIASLGTILPGACYVEIDTAGITIASSFRRKVFLWEQVDRIGLFEIGIIRRIGFDLNAKYQGPERVPNYQKSASGYHISLPNMGQMEPEKLLEVMEQCLLASRGKSAT